MEIEPLHKFKLADLEGKYLWRYINMYQLLDLLNNKRIFFTRFDQFEDSLEGLTYEDLNRKAYVQAPPLTMENTQHMGCTNDSKRSLIAEDKKLRIEYEDNVRKTQRSQYGSCWFLGEKESIAMWRIYANAQGIAVKVNALEITKTLIASAESYTNTDFRKFYLGPIDYKKLWPLDLDEVMDGKFNGLKKDDSYGHENEFRFVAVTADDKNGIHPNLTLPIANLETYDLKIISNPFINNWEFENLATLLDKYGLKSKLSKSQIAINK